MRSSKALPDAIRSIIDKTRAMETNRPRFTVNEVAWRTDYAEDFYDIVTQHTISMSTWDVTDDGESALGRAAGRLREQLYTQGFGTWYGHDGVDFVDFGLNSGLASEWTRFLQDVGAMPSQDRFYEVEMVNNGYNSKMRRNGYAGYDNAPDVRNGPVAGFVSGGSFSGGPFGGTESGGEHGKFYLLTGAKEGLWKYGSFAEIDGGVPFGLSATSFANACGGAGGDDGAGHYSLGEAPRYSGLGGYAAPPGLYWYDPQGGSSDRWFRAGFGGAYTDGGGHAHQCFPDGYVSPYAVLSGAPPGEVFAPGIKDRTCPEKPGGGPGDGCGGLVGFAIGIPPTDMFLAYPPVPNTGQGGGGAPVVVNGTGYPGYSAVRDRVENALAYYPAVASWYLNRLPLRQITRERYNWKSVPLGAHCRGHIEARVVGNNVFLRGYAFIINGSYGVAGSGNGYVFVLPPGLPEPDDNGFSFGAVNIPVQYAHSGFSPSGPPTDGEWVPDNYDYDTGGFDTNWSGSDDESRFSKHSELVGTVAINYNGTSGKWVGTIGEPGTINITDGPKVIIFDGMSGYVTDPSGAIIA